jgi:hypothetical protein
MNLRISRTITIIRAVAGNQTFPVVAAEAAD